MILLITAPWDSSFKISALDIPTYPLPTFSQESAIIVNNFSTLLRIQQLSLFLQWNPPRGQCRQEGSTGTSSSLKVSSWILSPAGPQLFREAGGGNKKEKKMQWFAILSMGTSYQCFSDLEYPMLLNIEVWQASSKWCSFHRCRMIFMLNTIYCLSYNFCK